MSLYIKDSGIWKKVYNKLYVKVGDVWKEVSNTVPVAQLSALVVPTVGAGGLGLIAVDPVSIDAVQLSASVVPAISVNTSVALE